MRPLKKYSFVVLILLFSKIGIGQNFYFSNGDSLSATFEINDYSWVHTKIKNESDSSVIFQWELITFIQPESWEFGICDFIYCYTLGETTGIMEPVEANSEQGFLTINVEADIADTGFYQIAVWDIAYPEAKDTLSATLIATPSYSSLSKIPATKISPTIYYDSQSVNLSIKNPTESNVCLTIYNTLGELILDAIIIEAFSEKRVDLSSLNTANYIAKIQMPEKNTFCVTQFYKQ